MDYLFNLAARFNADISGLDVLSETSMSGMFHSANCFNPGDMSKWDVFSVTTIARMFLDATSFNSDLSK